GRAYRERQDRRHPRAQPGQGDAGPESEVLARRFGGPNQVSESLLRSVPQLSSKNQLHHLAPPPGREVEVSIEPDQGAAFLGLGERHPVVVVDANRKMNDQVEPAVLRIEAADGEQDSDLLAMLRATLVVDLATR